MSAGTPSNSGNAVQISERQVALEFLDLVAQFWANPDLERVPRFRNLKAEHRRLLSMWKKEIERGQIPNSPHWPLAQATSEAKPLERGERPTVKADIEFPSSDGFAMRIKVEVAWTLSDEQEQRHFWLVERCVQRFGARRSMAEMTGRQGHAKFLSDLRDDVIMHMKMHRIQIDKFRAQVCVTHLSDDLRKRYRPQVVDDVLLLK